MMALLISETFSMKNTGMRTYASDMRLNLLRRETAFAAFKRCYVREHPTEYPELQQYVELDT